MASERTPLQSGQSQQSSRRSLAPALYGVSSSDADEPHSNDRSLDDADGRSMRVPRSVAYSVIVYCGLSTLASLTLLLALLIPTSAPSAAGGDVTPAPSTTDPPSSSSSHLPYGSRPSTWPSPPSASNFLVLADIHLEPHYNATSPQTATHVCRDAAHTSSCVAADWELPSSSPRSRASLSPFPFGRYLCDPPSAFVSSALTSLAASLSSSSTSVDFILLAGDLAAHFVPCPLTLYHTIDRVFSLVISAFPSIPVVFTIGNTDVFPTYYLPSPASAAPLSNVTLERCGAPFNSLLSILFRHGVLHVNDVEAVGTFCHGGYYAQVVAGGRVRVVSVNSLVWATDYSDSAAASDASTPHPAPQPFASRSVWRDNSSAQPIELTPAVLSFSFPSSYPSNLRASPPLPCSSPARVDDPYDQFRFLHAQLRLAAQASPPQSVHILGHVPPGIKPSASPSASWCPQYQRGFREVVERWLDVVQGLMFGDYSQDLVRVMGEGGKAQVVHVNPGLTMRKDVNPAARLYQYDRDTGKIVDYHQQYVDLTAIQLHTQQQRMEGQGKQGEDERQAGAVWTWQYSARQFYGMSEYGAEGWLSVAARMLTEREVLLRYVTSVNLWKAGEGDGVLYVCDMLALDEQSNAECRRTGRIPQTHSELE